MCVLFHVMWTYTIVTKIKLISIKTKAKTRHRILELYLWWSDNAFLLYILRKKNIVFTLSIHVAWSEPEQENVCMREGLDPCRNCIHRVAATTIRFYVQPVRQLDIIATGDVAHRVGYVTSIHLTIKTLYTPNSSFTV